MSMDPDLRRAYAREESLMKALKFYAEARRYLGPNRDPIPGDPFGAPGDSYIRSVDKDGGKIARDALKGRYL
jgi:hypothetical protein